MLCDDADGLKGSGRSIPEFDLHEALSGLGTLLTAFGGHTAAAGLRLERDGLENLREAFDAAARRRLGDTPPAPALVLDGELGFDAAADPGFLRELELLQPFGIGNPEPVFASPALDILKRDAFGPRKNHVRLKVRDPDCGVSLHAKIWRQAEALPASVRGKKIRLAYTPRLDRWNGASSVDVRVRDWKFA
jgi:single-stranded-DNA-specific exonuclease